jgi:hypothetical protein
MAINSIAWVTPTVVSMVLAALHVDGVVYANIYTLCASTAIEFGMCAMCPALYAIKWAILIVKKIHIK